MFAEDVIARRLAHAERTFGVKLHRYTIDESRFVTEVQLERKRGKSGKLEGLTLDEQLYQQNEILVSRCDYRYWFERFPKIILDDETGELGHPRLRRSQEIMVERLAEREAEIFRQYDLGHRRFDGNGWYVHKARQMFLTTGCQSIAIHAGNFYGYTNTLLGSKNLPKTQEMWRDYGHLMWETQPDWMRVPSVQDHKERGLVLTNGSKFILQHSEMESGFGQGAKWHRGHLSEVASWSPTVVSDHIDNHYEPSCSRSLKSVHFLESTAQEMEDYWHKNSERARAKRLNWWHYLFIPFWLIPDLYIDENVPDGWEPREETKKEEEIIIKNSPEFNGGHTFRPPLSMLFWWEKKYLQFKEKQVVNEFFKNYPSIPEESFVHSGRSSFPYEVLTVCESTTREPWAYYDILTNNTPNGDVVTEKRIDPYTHKLVDPPPIYEVDDIKLGPVHVLEEDKHDPLGLILVWETPDEVKPWDTYMAVDTTGGIENWNRRFRKDGEDDINNACIWLGRSTYLANVDVVEFAAPVTSRSLAPYANAIGRLWCGRNNMDGQTPTIIELTGEGLVLQEILTTDKEYFAYYQHYRFTGGDWVETNQYGFKSTPVSIRQAWTFYKGHVTDRNLIFRSKPAVKELRSCQDDQIIVAGMTRGQAPKKGGRHDDRVYARVLGIWYAESGANPEPRPSRSQVPRVVSEGPKKLKLHQMDFESPEAREQYLNDWEARIIGEGGGRRCR